MLKHTLLLMLCLVFFAAPTFAQIVPPSGLSADLDDQTGAVDLTWAHFNPDYYEDFEDGVADSWVDDGQTWAITDGWYHVNWSTPTWTSSYYSGQTFGDGLYEVVMRRTAGAISSSNSLFICADGYYNDQPAWSGYMINLTVNGSFLVVEFFADGTDFWHTPGWTGSDAINQGLGAENVMSIQVDGTNFTYFINGVEVYSWTGTLTAGNVAVGAATAEPAQVEWDYVGVDEAGVALAQQNAPAPTPINIPDNPALTHAPEDVRIAPRYNEPVSMLAQTAQNELDDFIEFRVYRDDVMIGTTTDWMFTDNLPDFGPYVYEVTSFYDEGESDPAGPLTVDWQDPTFFPINEDFNGGLPDGWTLEAYSGMGWFWDNGTGPGLFPTGYMCVDSDGEGSGTTVQTRMITPPIDLSGMTFFEVTFTHYFEEYIEEYGYFEYSVDGGANWTTVATYDADFAGNQTDTYDLAAALAGEDQVWLSWYYDDIGNWGWWWGVDEVIVYSDGGAGPQPATLNLTPTTDEVPATGGAVVYDANFMYNLGFPFQVTYWNEIELPNGQMYGPMVIMSFTATPGMNATATGVQLNVPAFAPAGSYVLYGRVGLMAGPYVEDSFPFTKLAAAANAEPVNEWSLTGAKFNISAPASQETVLPDKFAIEDVYPNPFNPTATVRVALPEASELNITVFNVMGQQVAELAQGQFSSGVHNFTIDGTGLTSGIYFVKAHVPGELNQVQKVTLMK